ncbi:MAG: CPBP family glutamic-type intramembrane protease [Peptostreptococcaceae bacterium]
MSNISESLVEEAKKCPKLPNIVWAIILCMIFMYGGSFIGAFAILPIYFSFGNIPYFRSNPELFELTMMLIGFIFASLVVFFRVIKIEKRSLASIGLCKENWFKKYSIGFIIGIAMMALVVLILFLVGCISIESNPTQPIGISAIVPITIILVGWVIQGGTEEILTRGWLMNVLGARYNIAVGLIVSSSFFGLLHLGNDNVNYLAVLNIILVGVFFGLYVIKTNDLWGACGMHSSWNFAQGNLFGFEVSGIDTSIGTLFDLNLVGSDFISGGPFGPEAGLVTTFVLIGGSLLICYLDKKGIFN